MDIRLGVHPACVHDEDCGPFAQRLHQQLSGGGYDYPVSLLQLQDFDAYQAEHRTARKRANHAYRLGYTASRIDRADHVDAIYRINTSSPERQGRPMSAGYQTRTEFSTLPYYPCPRHRIDEWGVFTDTGRLVGYLVVYLCGDLALVSQILGHADHLRDDIMYLLVATALEETLAAAGPVTVFYNRHDSGTDGLRFFKERLGFAADRADWAL